MKRKIIIATTLIAIGISACTDKNTSKEKVENLKTKSMNNLISIVEIPTNDFSRALNFYETILGIKIAEMEMDGNKMGILPNEEGTINVVLINGKDYKPTSDGSVLYLNAGDDLQIILDKVAEIGGQIIVPKTQISPEMGYFAMFIDCEGNKLGLHSTQ